MKDERFALVASAAFVLVVISGAVVAQTTGQPFTGTVELQSNSGMNITLQETAPGINGQLPQNPFQSADTISVGNNEFIGSNSEATVTALNASSGGFRFTNLTSVDVSSGPITIDTALATETTRIDGTVDDFAVTDAFNFTEAGHAELVASASGSWSLTVNNTGLTAGRGIVVENEATGDVLAGSSVDPNGNATISGLPSVTNARLDIKRGPSELKVFKESQPGQLATGAVLRLRVFEQGTDEVFEREVQNGKISLIGVPPDKPLTITVDDESNPDIVFRRTIIESVTEQQQVFLLNSSIATTAQIVFQIEDRTGNFPPRSTQLFVEKPITKDFDADGQNETRYLEVAGDTFGGTAEFQTVLEQNERYRLRVENGENSRVLGAYVAQIDDRSTIRIGEVNFDIPETSGFAADLKGITQNGNPFVRVKFSDPGGRTEELRYEVINERTNSTITTFTQDGPLGQHINTIALSEPLDNTSIRLDYEITRTQDDGTDAIRSGEAYAGQLDDFGTQIPIDGFWGGIIGLIGVVAVGGLGALFAPAVGAVGAVVTAALLTFVGLVSIPGAALGLASAISVLALVGRTR
jgi:hypothetical protein